MLHDFGYSHECWLECNSNNLIRGVCVMKEVLVLKDLKQIKAISQDYRIGILEAYNDEPATAKQISDKLGEPHAKVNYHIKALAKVGILELVEESVKLGIIEKYYLPVAKAFVIDSAAMKSSDKNVVASINQASHALFERISKEFYASLEQPEKELPNKLLHKTDFYLTEEEAKDLHVKLEDVIVEFLKGKDTQVEGTNKYFTSALIIPCDESNS